MSSEKVVCISADWFTKSPFMQKAGFYEVESFRVGLQDQGFALTMAEPTGGISLLMPGTMKDRTDELERDKAWKQVCTYTVVRRDGQILSYLRGKAGSEKRLHAKRSVGVGGHANRYDLESEAWREVQEELKAERGVWSGALLQTVGVVYTDDEVGSVHFGVVTVLDLLPEAEVQPNEDCMRDLSWNKPGVLLSFPCEPWSVLVLQYLVSKEAQDG